MEIGIIAIGSTITSLHSLLQGLDQANLVSTEGKNVKIAMKRKVSDLALPFSQIETFFCGPQDSFFEICNQCANQLEQDLLFFISDAIQPEDSLQKLAFLLQKSQADALSPVLVRRPENTLVFQGETFSTGVFYGYPSHGDACALPYTGREETIFCETLAADCFIIKKAAFQKAGGFHSDLFPQHFGVLALALEMRKKGLKAAYAPHISISMSLLCRRDWEQYGEEVVSLANVYGEFFSAWDETDQRGFLCPAGYESRSTKRGRLLLVPHELTNTGAPLLLLDMAMELKKIGYDIWFYACRNGPFAKNITENGFPLLFDEELFVGRGSPVSQMDYSIPVLLDHILEMAEKTLLNSIAVYNVAGRYVGTSYFMYWWIHESHSFWQVFHNWVPCLASNMHVLAISEYAQMAIEENRPDYTSEILNGFVYEEPVQEPLPVRQGEPLRFLLAGTVQRIKGQDVLIRAAMSLPLEYQKKITFCFAGFEADADMVHEIQTFCRIWPGSKYLGFVDRQELFSWIQISDVLLAPSRDDSFHLVSIEAMTLSKPTLFSDHVGVSRFVTSGVDGFVFPSEDEKALARSLMEIVDHRDALVEVGQASRRLYEKYFSPQVFQKRLQDFFPMSED